jgi:branched-chain amino acid transport system ATP-binding protein
MVLVEQDVSQALRMATRFQCLLEGRTTLEGRPGDFSPAEIESAYFGIAEARSDAPAAQGERR